MERVSITLYPIQGSLHSGQISIIPKPELRELCRDSLTIHHHFGVTNRRCGLVVIPDITNPKNAPAGYDLKIIVIYQLFMEIA